VTGIGCLGLGQKNQKDFFRLVAGLSLILSLLVISGCASIMKYDKEGQLKDIQDFDQQVKIESPGEGSTQATDATKPTPPVSNELTETKKLTPAEAAKAKREARRLAKKIALLKKKKSKELEAGKNEPAVIVSTKHEPDVEGQEGFKGRRPIKDPFRPGEKVVHEMSYFNVKAGELTLGVKPFALVNGQKNYDFYFGLKSSSIFSSFYSVSDSVDSLMTFDQMIPTVFTMHVKESKQLKEARFFIDWKKNQASYWEKKVVPGKEAAGPEEKKLQWEVPEYTQDVFSSAFYVRVFDWDVGTEHAFRVTDNGENLVFKGKALRREVLDTDAGKFKTIVIKPEVTLRGQFKPVGDIFLWLTDDDRKFIVRIESKIKIGTVVSEVISINRGSDEASPGPGPVPAASPLPSVPPEKSGN